ncbi:activating molecule in BECN1-regulated autophagy protein 1-like isoform X1 [Anopheles aquasalis]|uniref:activating molecule in BECN1-regulated autophagy protein 1-like isoform X1 n=1 Tax=Anopheles aquasalis TaxID=42839 RepID=UPI00215B6560|nr:activating molecule in BECN1-regulated autophagy protein 1-like isoform X1 [Anopheles aquasalis]
MVVYARNIVDQLLHRERGFRRPRFRNSTDATTSLADEGLFCQVATELAEWVLINRLKTEDLCKPLDDLTSETESVFNIEQSHDGIYTATAQTNKSVNVFHTPSMRRVAKHCSGERSVCTLAFHPTNANVLAFGTLGGSVSVYVNGKLTTSLDVQHPIGSLCFHPTRNCLLLTGVNEIIFWNWDSGRTCAAEMQPDSKCRFLHVTRDARLITGISGQSLPAPPASGDNSLEELEPESLVEAFLRHTNRMLERLEKTLDSCLTSRPNSLNRLEAELGVQMGLWIVLMQTINRKRADLRLHRTPQPTDKCITSDLNLTLVTFNRRIDVLRAAIFRKIGSPVFTIEDIAVLLVEFKLTDLRTEPMYFFEKICQQYIYRGTNRYIQYNFDLSLVSQILQKAISLFYSFALIDFTREIPWTSSSDYSLQYLSLISNYNHAITQSQLCVLQVWDLDRMDDGDVDSLPNFKEDWKNVITNGIINIDSNVAISQCEKFMASVRFRSVKELEIRSLQRYNFGEQVFLFKFVINFVSLSFSPSGRYVIVGLRCTRNQKYAYILDRGSRWRMGSRTKAGSISHDDGARLALRLPATPDRYREINCIRWATLPGYGLLVGLKSKFIQICR